jgi:hypothetical protein
MEPNQCLHLILTNPQEIKVVLAEDWPSAREILDAIRAGEYQILYRDELGEQLLDKLKGRHRRKKGAVSG